MQKIVEGDPYTNLANAIIIQATKDYISALKKLKCNQRNKAALKEAMEIERFFHSSWYGALTLIDPDYLIRELRKKVIE